MSPEVLIKKAPANPSMDIWALGVILYRMIYGIYPFEGENV
jgi:serine/threonine protein kinase